MKERGLSQSKAEETLKKYGPNEIKDVSKTTPLKILFRQIKNNFVIYLLLFAVFLSLSVSKFLTSYIILAVILIVIATGFFQEYRAEKAMDSLKNMLVPISIVIRDGIEKEIQTREVVPGDLIILRSGERISADCVVIEQDDLLVNESLLTGESKEIAKKTLFGKEIKDENLIFAGTFVVGGRCIARVLNTGMQTRFGKIAGLISSVEKELPLQKKVNKIAKYMAIFGITFAVITGLIMILRVPGINQSIVIDAVIVAISVAVASFPEGFPVVLITSLASGVHRMAKKNAIVNRMSIIETLGETTVICTDKTGTITKGEMTIKKIYCDKRIYSVEGAGFEGHGDIKLGDTIVEITQEKTLSNLIRAGVLCNESKIFRKGEDNLYSIIGLPTEAALLILGAKAKIFREDLNSEKIAEIPFSSERKMMSILIKEKKENIVYSKGAPEVLINKCAFIQRENGVFRITGKEKKEILALSERLGEEAYRTLALAYKKTNNLEKEDLENSLIFLGLMGIEDPPRPEIKEALAICKQAGITVKMITGDSRKTAISIANQIGLEKGEIVDFEELEAMTDLELEKRVAKISIFARVKPEQKLRIVRALKINREIVTMTGDGVNDAPALKEAHIGVAMGINGTDVSRSVADLTLKDDNFATIVDAIREGRTIFNNIQKFTTYQVSINFSQVMIVLLAILIGLPLPLLAIQILFMNLFSDEITAITLAFNPYAKDIMDLKPRKDSSILTKHLLIMVVVAGLIISLSSLLVFKFALSSGLSEVASRTIVFTTMVLFGITNAYNFRSFRKLSLARSPMTNKYLFYSSFAIIASLVLMIYTPIGKVFELTPIRVGDFVICSAVSLFAIIIFDLFKYYNHKKKIWQECHE